MTAQDLNLSKPLEFGERWLLCAEYLKHRETMRKTNDEICNDMFLLWFLRLVWPIASAIVICAGASSDGFKGFLHSTAFIGSLWWLFYFLHRETLLNTQLTRKWFAFLMASVRLSKNEFELFQSNLAKSVYALKKRPLMFFFTYIGMFFVADWHSGTFNSLIVIMYITIGLVHVYLSVSTIEPFLSAYCCGKITAVAAKRLISLVAWQDLGGLLAAVISLTVIQTIYLMTGFDHELAVSLDIGGCYHYFLLAAIAYFFSQAIPVLVSLIAPALTLNKRSSGIFCIITTIGLVIMVIVGFTVFQVFVVAFAATVFWNMYVFFSQNLLAFKFGPALKSFLVSFLGLGFASIGSYFFELTFNRLGISTTAGVSFFILLTCAVWIDCVAFGLLSSFEL